MIKILFAIPDAERCASLNDHLYRVVGDPAAVSSSQVLIESIRHLQKLQNAIAAETALNRPVH